MRPVIMAFLVWLLLLLIIIGSSAPAPVARPLHVTGTLPPTNTPRTR